jgi:hydrogenase expression/formation protein HypE
MSERPDFANFTCPLPKLDHDTVQMAHGAGGRLSADLFERLILPRFTSPELEPRDDGALLDLAPGRVAFSTDTFVVTPLFFPGGDIGTLAVCGTVNDVAMMGGVPQALSVAFVLEEGLPLADFHRILCSMEATAKQAGVRVVTGDTKVVGRGQCDGIYINTSGIGVVPAGRDLGAHRIAAGDVVLVSGPVGDHGTAILTARAGLGVQTQLKSDCAPLNGLVEALLGSGADVKALRDPTRGGLAAVLNEYAAAARVGIRLDDDGAVPVRAEVAGVCEMLGLDPLHMACEGRLVAIVAADDVDRALAALQGHEHGGGAARIGAVNDRHVGVVTMATALGVERVLDMPLGEQLPRIC